MNYFITGGCGFIGSNYINHLFKNKKVKKIINLDILYYCASIYNIEENVRVSDRYTFIKGDLNDYDLIVNILKEHRITHIVHFAAQSHVDNSFDDSLQYTYDNVKGTHTLLEAIKNTNKNIVMLHFSTDEVYGETENNEMDEGSILCPTNPYSASKAAAEMYVRAYIFSYKLKIIISRGNNVFGYNQYPEKLIPKFINLLREGKKCTIHGNGKTIRNFIFVDDVCTSVDYIINRGTFGQVYNIGSDHSYERSVMDVTKLLVKKIKNDDNYTKYIEKVDDRPFNDKRYLISNEKLKELGWKQLISFDDGIDLLLKYNDDTMIILFKPNEEDLIWNNFYDKLKETLAYNIQVYSNNKEYSDIDDNISNIYDLINYMKNNKDYRNFLIIDDYKRFNYEGLNKNIDNFNNLQFKNICSGNSFDDKLLDINVNDFTNNFTNNFLNILININKLNRLDKDYNFESFKNLKINLLDYFFVIYNYL
jgi:dTDP-glucose 4,6-dehydratase/UDP-glucose 4,6-dehydratase